MKTTKILSLGLIAAASLTLGACSDFLDEKPATSITEEQMYSDPEYAEASIISCYNGWRNMFTDARAWHLLIGTDEIQSGAFQALKEDQMRRGSYDRYDALLTSDLGPISDQWGNRWKPIGETAKLIRSLRPIADTSEKIGHSYGHASFIRGGLYLELAMVYGRLPILDLERAGELGGARQSETDVWAFIINDLKEAVKYLPDTAEPGRGTTYAANMLLGYAYMCAPESTGLRDFKAASECLKKVLDGPFSLVDYRNLWDYETPNTTESIFEWQFSNTYPDNNMIQFQIGSRACAAMGGDQCFMSGYDHAVPTAWAYSDLADGGIWEDGDVRKEESMRYDFTWFDKTPDYNSISWEDIGEDHDELAPHIKKYEDFRTDSHSGLGLNNMWYSGKNIPFLRLANAMLLYAECLNELGQTSDAVGIVNQVRSRAWDFSLPADKAWPTGMSKDKFREELMTERVRELFGERWRKFDLVRTGNFVKLVGERNKWAKRSGTIAEYNKVWPIPLSEIDQNEDISPADQNEGYR